MPRLILLLILSTISMAGLQAQTRTLRGKVSDAETRSPLANVSVSATGDATPTITAADGSFTMNVKGKLILIVKPYRLQNTNGECARS